MLAVQSWRTLVSDLSLLWKKISYLSEIYVGPLDPPVWSIKITNERKPKEITLLEPGWYKRKFHTGAVRVYYVTSHKVNPSRWVQSAVYYKTITEKGLENRANYNPDWAARLVKTDEDDIDVNTRKTFNL
jgi:hypothetical protein